MKQLKEKEFGKGRSIVLNDAERKPFIRRILIKIKNTVGDGGLNKLYIADVVADLFQTKKEREGLRFVLINAENYKAKETIKNFIKKL